MPSDKGVIRDEKCAVAVGVAILSSVYGEEPVRNARFTQSSSTESGKCQRNCLQ